MRYDQELDARATAAGKRLLDEDPVVTAAREGSGPLALGFVEWTGDGWAHHTAALIVVGFEPATLCQAAHAIGDELAPAIEEWRRLQAQSSGTAPATA